MMDVNHNITPFGFFQKFLESDKLKILINIFLEENVTSYTKIDKIKAEITYFGQHYDSYGSPDKFGDILYILSIKTLDK